MDKYCNPDPLDPVELMDLMAPLDLKDPLVLQALMVNKDPLDLQVPKDLLDLKDPPALRALMGHRDPLDHKGLPELKAPLDLEDTLVLQVEGLSTPDGDTALVHISQALRWSTLASWREQNGTIQGMVLITCACHNNESTVMS